MKNVVTKDKIQNAVKRIIKGRGTTSDFLLITEYQNSWVYQDETEPKITYEENCLLFMHQAAFN
jgi:hypothetical protein